MKFWHTICLTLFICIITLIGCRSGNGKHSVDTSQNDIQASDTSDTQIPSSSQQSNRLILSMPDCSNKKAGETFEVILNGEFLDPFYQISGRLEFDSNSVRPTSCSKGDWFTSNDIEYFNLNQKDILPFALTPKYGKGKARTGKGTLARFQFQIIDPSKDCRVQLENNLTNLQVRNEQQGRLNVNLEREVTK